MNIMFDKKYSKHMLILTVLGCLSIGSASAGNLYRYTNNLGNTVLDDRIPPEYVGKGYQILSKSGRLLEVIPAHTDKPQGSTEQQEEAAKQRLREDRYILASYSSRKEIRQASERKLGLLEREIRIVEGNLADTRGQRDRERMRAANYQRGGKLVPEALKIVLVELDEEENKALLMLEERRKEHTSVKILYEKYEVRFVELTGLDHVLRSVPSGAISETEKIASTK